jgi:hypothetical protein
VSFSEKFLLYTHRETESLEDFLEFGFQVFHPNKTVVRKLENKNGEQ